MPNDTNPATAVAAQPEGGAAAAHPSTQVHAHIHDDGSVCHHDHSHDHHHHPAPVVTYTRGAPKIGRNDACPCGSGKKHKKCCLPA